MVFQCMAPLTLTLLVSSLFWIGVSRGDIQLLTKKFALDCRNGLQRSARQISVKARKEPLLKKHSP